MTKTCSHLLFIFVFLIVCSTAKNASAETFQYSGYLESDSARAATMNLSVSGQTVTGNLSLKPVCQSNARLPGAEFNLSGDVNGQWEGKGSISGTWTGVVRWCDKDEDRSGSFSISVGQGSVMFSSNGSYYNRYVFSPTGKVSDPAASSSTPGSGTAGEPSAAVYRGPSLSSLALPTSGFGIPPEFRKTIVGVVEMSMNETRLFIVPTGGGQWGDAVTGKLWESISSCSEAGYFTEPGSILSDSGKVGDGINVKAIGEGIGKVWGGKTGCICIAGGEKKKCALRAVWLVVVGAKGLREYEEYTGQKKPSTLDSVPEPDIAKAVLKGRVVMVGTKKPVPNAQLSLLSSRGGTYYQDNWRSGSNGTFSFRADNMLTSGVYEVMAQLRSAEMGTTEDPSTVNKDLWPVKQYHVTITRDSALKGSIDVGDIEMDTVLKIFGGWDTDNNTIVEGSGRDGVEDRTPVTKSSPSKQPVINKKPTSSGYNPLGDPNLKSPTSRNPIDVAAVDKLSNDFQDGYGKTEKPDQNSQQAPISQPDSYTGSGKKDDPGNAQPTSSTGYPPYDYPQYSGSGYNNPRSHGVSTWTSVCNSSQKHSAYLTGLQCGKKAKQNNGTMTRNCVSALQTYRNIESRSGWGTCLSDAFDAGYREGPAQVPGPQSPSTPKTPSKITAELENKAGDNVHIFVEGQDNFGPHNRLGPGQKRTITLNISAGQTINFVAGRNGQVLARCNWTPNPGSSGGTAYIRFSGSSTVTCATK